MVRKDLADGDSLDRTATIVERLAVLLGSGVTPLAAWGYLAGPSGSSEGSIVEMVARTPPGASIGDAILTAVTIDVVSAGSSVGGSAGGNGARPWQRRGPGLPPPDHGAWRGLAAAWIVASDAGAPLASSLHDFAASLRSLAQARRATSEALAGPIATAKLVVVLPFVGVLFGVALGFDTIGVLFHTAPGVVCLVLGVSLLLLARAWNRKLVGGAMPHDLTPGLSLDLTAIAVSGGAALGRARSSVALALDRCGIPESDDVDSILDLSRRAGVPAGVLLRSEADRVRRELRSAVTRKAASLSVTLMLPLGLCVLPAFLLLGVAPLMIAVLSSTVGAS